MEQSLLVLSALIPVLALVGIGAGLRTRKVLQPEMEQGLMKLVVNVLLPALTLEKIVGNEALADFGSVATVAGFGFGMTAISFFLAYWAAGLMQMEKGTGKRTFGVTAGIQNYGYMGVPLLIALFESDGALGVLFTHNVGVEIALWTIGVALMSGSSSLKFRMLLKPPILAVIAGLLLNALGLDWLIEGAPRAILVMLGNCAIPLALLVIGAGLVELLVKQKFDWKIAIGAIFTRLAFLPAIMLTIAYFLPLSIELRQVIVVQAAMPAAMFPIVLAKHYNGKPELAVQVVVSTTVACFLTVPIVIVIGMKLLGV